MTTFLLSSQNLPFAAALALMFALLALLLAGLGDLGQDADGGVDTGGALAWLGLGRVPLAALLVILLTAFGLIGLKAQAVAQMLTGSLLSAWVAAPAALLASLPVTRVVARAVGRLLPAVETSAVDQEALVGRRGVIAVGRAAPGSAARARVRDHLGQTHHVMVEPEGADAVLAEGAEILLTRRDGARFRAIAVEPHSFLTLIEGRQ